MPSSGWPALDELGAYFSPAPSSDSCPPASARVLDLLADACDGNYRHGLARQQLHQGGGGGGYGESWDNLPQVLDERSQPSCAPVSASYVEELMRKTIEDIQPIVVEA